MNSVARMLALQTMMYIVWLHYLHRFTVTKTWFWFYSALNTAADVMLLATMTSEVQAPSEAMEKETVLQPCCTTAAPHGVHLFPYFLDLI